MYKHFNNLPPDKQGKYQHIPMSLERGVARAPDSS